MVRAAHEIIEYIVLLAQQFDLPARDFHPAAVGKQPHVSGIETLLTAALVVGGLVAWFVSGRSKDEGLNKARFDRGTLIASGFIAGGALMGVVSAVLKFVGVDWFLSGWASSNAAEWTGLAMYLVLIGYFAWHTLRAKKEE